MSKAEERQRELGRLFNEWHRVVTVIRPRILEKLSELHRKENERVQVYRNARTHGLLTAANHLKRIVDEESAALSHLDRELSFLQRDVVRQRQAVRKFWENIKD